MKKKKNKKIKIVLLLCSLFMCLCSVLCLVPFNDDKIEVYADEIISDVVFESSRLIVPTARYTYKYVNGVRTQSSPFNLRSYANTTDFSFLNTEFWVKFRYDPDTGALQFAPYFYFFVLQDDYTYEFSDTGYTNAWTYTAYNYCFHDYSGYRYSGMGSYSNLSDYNTNTDIIVARSDIGPFRFETNNSEVTGIVFEIVSSSVDIDLNKMSYMTIGLDASTARSRYLVTYYDSNANYVQFKFACGSWETSFPLRTYYFNTGIFTDNEYYNQGYSQGQQAGYVSGYENGESAGYNTGYNVGVIEGYNNGYGDGSQDSNQYTFMNLLSATIDAPIKYFQSLFNFELLGVNLQGFLTGLFTLCVIVTIVKLCLGG